MEVLLVEGEPEMCALLQAILESRGHTVTTAADGEIGWKNYQSRHFPLVILDWPLPDTGGLEMCRKIRSSQNGADSQILVIAARTNPGDLEQILSAGADDFLAKPVDQPLLNIRLAMAEQRARNLIPQQRGKTARKTAEPKSSQAETMLQLVLDTIPSRVFWKDQESRYLGCNRLFAMDAGRQDPSQIVGKTDHDLCWAEQAPLYISSDRAVMQSMQAKVDFEMPKTAADGKLMYLIASKIPLTDGEGNLIGVLGTYQDISERKQAQKDLWRQKYLIRQVIDTDPNLIFVKDAEGKFLLVNQAMAKAYGKTPQELIGQNGAALYPNKAETDPFLETDREMLETRHSVELLNPNSLDGNGRWFLTIKTPMKQPDGTVNVLGIAVDITERKLAEERLGEAYKDLEKLTTHLEVVRENEQKRIARELHDELGGVLAALNINTSLLAAQIPAEMMDIQAKAADLEKLVAAGIQTMQRTVTELRPSLLDEVGLTFAIERYVQEFEKNTEIECDLHLPEEELTPDRNQSSAIFRIIQESLTNVAKHAKASRVSIVLSDWETSLVLTVKDNGKGFDLDAQKANSFGLLGIGERASMVGGKAQITSAEGKGTTVRVSLPRIASRHEGGSAN